MATLLGAWCYRASAGTGWPGVSILWQGEIESLICNFYLSVVYERIAGTLSNQQTTSLFLVWLVIGCFARIISVGMVWWKWQIFGEPISPKTDPVETFSIYYPSTENTTPLLTIVFDKTCHPQSSKASVTTVDLSFLQTNGESSRMATDSGLWTTSVNLVSSRHTTLGCCFLLSLPMTTIHAPKEEN